MLRLLPDRLVALVLADNASLYRAGGGGLLSSTPALGVDVSLPDALDALLADYARSGQASIELIVSDRTARLVPLVWQDSLSGDDQLAAYARACFDQAGFDLGKKWLVQAGFRHFRATGLGYALPRSIVVEIKQHLAEHGIRLRSIMPLSAYAYWHAKSGIRGQCSVLMFRERNRMSALMFEAKNCAGFFVQPVGAGLVDTARRLMNTMEAVFPSIARVHYWSPEASESEAESLRNGLSVPNFETLSNMGWN